MEIFNYLAAKLNKKMGYPNEEIASHPNCPAEVIPGLYIGSLGDALSDWPVKNNIDLIINISNVCYSDKIWGKLAKIPHKEIIMDDKFLYPYDEYVYVYKFQDAAKAIENVLSKNGRVLVHCVAGINRSATAIMFYLIRRGFTYEQAYALLAKANQKRGVRLLTNVSFRQLAAAQCDIKHDKLGKIF